MKVTSASIGEVFIMEPQAHIDDRGFLMETYSSSRYAQQGAPLVFVQDNASFSKRGVLRGLHLQNPHPQGKLVQALQGEIFDVGVDLRIGSPTFKKWVGVILSEQNRRQMYIPPGFAHGFWVKSETALVTYKCTDYYHAKNEVSVIWNDPDIGIDWPGGSPILSEKDRSLPYLAEIAPSRLPIFAGGNNR